MFRIAGIGRVVHRLAALSKNIQRGLLALSSIGTKVKSKPFPDLHNKFCKANYKNALGINRILKESTADMDLEFKLFLFAYYLRLLIEFTSYSFPG